MDATIVNLQQTAAGTCTEWRCLLNVGINEDRNVNCDDMVDSMIADLKEKGFSLFEAELFFTFARARLQNVLLEQPLLVPIINSLERGI